MRELSSVKIVLLSNHDPIKVEEGLRIKVEEGLRT
jgi:hypothetical protein